MVDRRDGVGQEGVEAGCAKTGSPGRGFSFWRVFRLGTGADRLWVDRSRTLVCACLFPRFHTTWSALVPGRTLYALWIVTSNRYLSAFHPATLRNIPSTIVAADSLSLPRR